MTSGSHYAYERIVCLLHTRFGGSVHAFEVSSYSNEPRRLYDETLLQGYNDDADKAVHAAAVARFESEWARNPQAESCMRAVRRAAAASPGGPAWASRYKLPS